MTATVSGSDTFTVGVAKPLHVQVAEALGITVMLDDAIGYAYIPDERSFKLEPVQRYDTDWSAAGQLIDRYGLSVVYIAAGRDPVRYPATWAAFPLGAGDPYLCVDDSFLIIDGTVFPQYGETAQIAVCRLILALAGSGELVPRT